jgi:hypothetical protein
MRARRSVPSPTPQSAQQESPKAAQAFADYVDLGPARSLKLLAQRYVEQKRYKTTTTAKGQLARWSVQFHWQERLTAAASARSERLLEQAAEIDADSFYKSSVELNKAITKSVRSNGGDIRHVISIRESVRKPSSKGSTSVNVSLSVEVRQAAEKMAAELGISPEELIADAEEIAQRAWTKA